MFRYRTPPYAIFILMLALLLTGCDWVDKFLGDDDKPQKRTPGRPVAPLFDLSGTWYPELVECDGHCPISCWILFEIYEQASGHFTIEQIDNYLEIDIDHPEMDAVISIEGTIENDQVRYEYDQPIGGVDVHVQGEGTAVTDSRIEVDEVLEAEVLGFLPVTLHCFTVLIWTGELP